MRGRSDDGDGHPLPALAAPALMVDPTGQLSAIEKPNGQLSG